MNITVREIYDGFAETYEKNWGLFDIMKVLASFYGRLHVEKGRLLDLGCGAGDGAGSIEGIRSLKLFSLG